MMKDCNNMSRADFLNYAAQFGKEASVGLLLLCGPNGFDEDRYVFGCRKFFESSGEWVDVMLDDYCSSGERRCCEPVE